MGLGGLGGFLPIILIVLVFYFLMIRPQQKKVKEHKTMVANLRRGDRVVTQGGIVGLVTKVLSDAEVQVEISDGVRVRLLRSAVSDVLSKSAPAEGGAAEAAEAVEKKGKGK
ncbi:MAG: preprotein translocase subunit YajC [Rhodospirillaceae bacterium]|nr:preprotein translocase subunit YajC [Rhodospirillaceae bacterium]